MALRDLSAFLEDDALEYPLPVEAFVVKDGGQPKFPQGKTYKVPSPDAKTGLWLTTLADIGVTAAAGGEITPDEAAQLHLDDDEERTFYQRVLGPVYAEMLDDGVKWTTLQAVARDAYLCFAMSRDTADLALAGQGKRAARPNRASRRAAKKTAGGNSRRASTGTATPTPTPASPALSTSPNESGAAEAV